MLDNMDREEAGWIRACVCLGSSVKVRNKSKDRSLTVKCHVTYIHTEHCDWYVVSRVAFP